jgi:uncharacterized protein (DUF302 family)
MNKNLFTGIIAGALSVIILIYFLAPGIMINENISKFGFDETVEKLVEAANQKGWKVPTTHQLDKSVANAGYDVLQTTVIELCHPGHAGKILSNDEDKVVTSMMPCRLSVYKKSNGEVIVSRMNTGLISKLFGGNISDVMADATQETEEIVSVVL